MLNKVCHNNIQLIKLSGEKRREEKKKKGVDNQLFIRFLCVGDEFLLRFLKYFSASNVKRTERKYTGTNKDFNEA